MSEQRLWAPILTPGSKNHPLIDFVRQAGEEIYARLSSINEMLSIVEHSLPVDVFPTLDRIHCAIAELVAIVDGVVAGDNCPDAATDFSKQYRNKLTQISVRLYRLQRETCAAGHHQMLEILQQDVLDLGMDYPGVRYI